MTTYTPNYHLPLYEDSDKPNLRDQYNGAINAIDTQFADVATDNTTTQNLIANINRDIEAANASIAKVNEDISALQTVTSGQTASITTLTDHLNTVDSELGQVGAKAAANAQNIATQSAYWAALNVDNIDEAIDLNKDIKDAHTTSITNQAEIVQIRATQVQQGNTLSTHSGQIQNIGEDISTLEGNVQALSTEFDRTIAKGWEVTSVTTSIGTPTTLHVFTNPAKNAMKLGGALVATGAQLNSSTVAVPGADGYFAHKVLDLSTIITPPDEAIFYDSICWMFARDASGAFRWGPQLSSWALGTDGWMYFYPRTSQYSWNTDWNFYAGFDQPIMSLIKADFTPVVPPMPTNGE